MRLRPLRLMLQIWLPIAAFAIWWLLSAHSKSLFYPPLHEIVDSFKSTFLTADGFRTEIWPSVSHLLIGYAIAVVVGIAIGVVLALHRWTHDLFDPLLQFLRALPAPALLPFAIVVIGIGASMKIAIIAFGAFFPVLLNTLDGVRGIDPTAVETCDVYRMSWWLRLRAVIVPGALPRIFTGMRVALQVGLLLMVVSEMVASTGGIGYVILQSQQEFTTPKMWAGILFLGVLGFVLSMLFDALERWSLRWYFAIREESTT